MDYNPYHLLGEPFQQPLNLGWSYDDLQCQQPNSQGQPLKIGRAPRIVFQPSMFRCKLAVIFREGIQNKNHFLKTETKLWQNTFHFTTGPIPSCNLLPQISIVSKNDMDVSKNRGVSPQIIHFNGFFIINHPFWGTPIFGNTHVNLPVFSNSFTDLSCLAGGDL